MRGERHPTIDLGTPASWPTLAPLLLRRAELLQSAADDDSDPRRPRLPTAATDDEGARPAAPVSGLRVRIGLVVLGDAEEHFSLSLRKIEDKWIASFHHDPTLSASGFGAASMPWRAVQRAAWAAMKRAA
jgi:hypothetical protein